MRMRNTQFRSTPERREGCMMSGSGGGESGHWVAALEDYTPTIPDSLCIHYLQSAGFKTDDPRVVRLVSLAAQKFISEVAMDALQHSKRRGPSQGSKKGGKDRKLILTLEDLAPALSEFGITVKKPSYYT